MTDQPPQGPPEPPQDPPTPPVPPQGPPAPPYPPPGQAAVPPQAPPQFTPQQGQQGYAGYPPQPGAPGFYPVAQSSSKATVSLVLGILAFFLCPVILSIAAIVVGNQAKNEIAASGGMLTGEGSAKWGVILGWVSLALAVIVFLVYFAVIAALVTNDSTSDYAQLVAPLFA